METITIPSPSAFLRKSPVNDSSSIANPAPIQPSTSAGRRSLASSGRSPTTSGVHNGGITKPKQSKSRNGCITCKGKRLKCDESKPTCEQCRKRNVQCGGYSKAFKWRSFEEANFTGKSGPKPRKVSPPPPPSPSFRNISAQAPSVSSPSNDSNVGPSPAPESDGGFKQAIDSPDAFRDPYLIPNHYNGFPTPISPHFPKHIDYVSQPQTQNVYEHQSFVSPYVSDNSCHFQMNADHLSQPRPIHPSHHPSSFPSGSPTLRDILLPGTDLNSPPPSIELRPPQSPLPYMPSGYTPPADADGAVDDDGDVEEIVRRDDPIMNLDQQQRIMSNNWSFRLPSTSPSPSESSSSSNSSIMDLWAQPRLPNSSQEMLLVQFDRQTCGILSVKDGPNENPWRTVLWPMAQESKHLYHAIAALTAFHSSKAAPELRMDGMKHMHKSVTNLATSLHDMRFDDPLNSNEIDAALATTLVLAFSESWDRHVSSGIEHLKGAKYFVNQAVIKHQNAVQSGRSNMQQLHRLRFLCNTFIYMDVIARLTSLKEDDLDDLDTVLTTFNQPFDNMPEIDPLMGAASTLFPLIGRVAAIVKRVRKSSTNSFTLISDAIELKRRIEQWQPPASVSFEIPEDPTSEVQHSVQTAEAYRWATLLYLHQAVPEIPSDPAAILANRVLTYLATVPLSSRTIIVQIFPLLAASCEAITQEDRQWVRDRWAAMSARLSIGNVDKCFDVVKEVWDRRDCFEAAKANRLLRRQAAWCVPMNESPSPISVRGTKRKMSNADNTNRGVFFNGSGGSDFATVAEGSFSKRRAMTDQNGLPHSGRFDNESTAASIDVDTHRAATMPQLPKQTPLPSQPWPRKGSIDSPLESMELEYTVRGRLHWIGVMSDFKWEVLLG